MIRIRRWGKLAALLLMFLAGAATAEIMFIGSAGGVLPEKTERAETTKEARQLLGKEFLEWPGEELLKRGACE